jgi:hypothetical protein
MDARMLNKNRTILSDDAASLGDSCSKRCEGEKSGWLSSERDLRVRVRQGKNDVTLGRAGEPRRDKSKRGDCKLSIGCLLFAGRALFTVGYGGTLG